MTHAVLFQVDMKQGWEGDAERELEFLVGSLRGTPGFLRGTWAADGARGVSFLVFDSGEAAHAVADTASLPPDASAVLRSADVYEVVREG